MTQPTSIEQLTAFLAARDVDCPSCGYNMRGCTTSTCPECGQQLALGLLQRETTTRADAWWLSGVFGVAVALGLCIFTFVPLLEPVAELLQQPSRLQLASAGMVSQSELPNWWLLVRVAVVLSALAAWLGWLLLARRRLIGWRSGRRIVLLVITATAPIWIISVLRILTQL